MNNTTAIRLLRELIKEEINQIKPFFSFASHEENPAGRVARQQDLEDPELMDPDLMSPEESSEEDLTVYPVRNTRAAGPMRS